MLSHFSTAARAQGSCTSETERLTLVAVMALSPQWAELKLEMPANPLLSLMVKTREMPDVIFQLKCQSL